MKIAIINNSGNVGKSFLSRELFYPNMENGIIIEVETHNSSSQNFNVNTAKIDGNEFDRLFSLMYKHDEYIVDVGASQVIPFINELSKSKNTFEDLDFIIVPVTNSDKIQRDTLKTLILFENLGFSSKVRVILNKADNLKQFKGFIEFVKSKTNIEIDTNLRILNYDVLNKLDEAQKCAYELVRDNTDFKALAIKAFKSGDDEEGTTLAELDYMKKFSVGIKKNMDKVYALLLATR